MAERLTTTTHKEHTDTMTLIEKLEALATTLEAEGGVRTVQALRDAVHLIEELETERDDALDRVDELEQRLSEDEREAAKVNNEIKGMQRAMAEFVVKIPHDVMRLAHEIRDYENRARSDRMRQYFYSPQVAADPQSLVNLNVS